MIDEKKTCCEHDKVINNENGVVNSDDHEKDGKNVLQENTESIESFLQDDVKENEIERCQAEISLWQDQCKRISAEFENFKKRSDRDQLRWIELSKEKILKDMLPIVDDFARALKQELSNNSGLQLMYNSFIKVLQKNDVTIMQNCEMFDPEFHDAVVQVDSKDHKSGQIVEVFAQGFMIKDRVLRHAQVAVAK